MAKQDITRTKTTEAVYNNIRSSIMNAQNKIVRTVNSAIVEAYWEIGEQIYKECGESDRAEYGKQVLKYLSERLTKEFGKGFDVTNLRKMRQFYCAFPKRDTLCLELGWSHYNAQIFTSKYKLYMPTEEELKRELNLEKYRKVANEE